MSIFQDGPSEQSEEHNFVGQQSSEYMQTIVYLTCVCPKVEAPQSPHFEAVGTKPFSQDARLSASSASFCCNVSSFWYVVG